MTKNHRNFTSYLAEVNKDQTTFEYKDKTYTLAPSLPLGVMLLVLDMEKRGQELVKPADTFELMRLVIGPEQFNGLVADGISLAEMQAVFEWAMSAYTGDNRDPKK